MRGRKKTSFITGIRGGLYGAMSKGLLCLCIVLSLFVTGCGQLIGEDSDTQEEPSGETIQIVLTTGFSSSELFRLEDVSCTLPEFMVYLTTEQNLYEQVYGTGLWERNDGAAQEQLKESVLAELSQIKAMTLLSSRRDVVLTEEEQEQAAASAATYYATLNETERELLGVDEALLLSMYQDYYMADKVYQSIISDINPEISDDEARTITVQHILLKTSTTNADGSVTEYSDSEKARRLLLAEEILEQAQEGVSFETLMEKYSEADQGTLSFGKGDMEEAFETAAFNLGNGEISDVVETSEGYEIIKCVSTFNREETDRNKQKIVEERRNEVFSEEYDAFVDSIARDFNELLWETVTLIRDDAVTTDQFFAIYEQVKNQT